jgi:hypothetical protein
MSANVATWSGGTHRGMDSEHLSAEPIVLAVQRRGIQPGRSSLAQKFYRARRAGYLTPHAADEICIRLLGCHPIEVYGDLWIASDELATA